MSRIQSLGVAALLLSVALSASCRQRLDVVTIGIGGQQFRVEVARSEEQKRQGLMFRRRIPPRRGMIFVYQADQHLSFWMKNTLVPLSLAFLSADGQILQIEQMKAESLRAVTSRRAARYALEVHQGTFAELGVEVGDRVDLPLGFPGR